MVSWLVVLFVLFVGALFQFCLLRSLFLFGFFLIVYRPIDCVWFFFGRFFLVYDVVVDIEGGGGRRRDLESVVCCWMMRPLSILSLMHRLSSRVVGCCDVSAEITFQNDGWWSKDRRIRIAVNISITQFLNLFRHWEDPFHCQRGGAEHRTNCLISDDNKPTSPCLKCEGIYTQTIEAMRMK